jgi:hypothetical protein
VGFSPDGEHFAYCGQYGRLVIRDTTTFKLQREWKLPGDLSRVLYALLPCRRQAISPSAAI